MRNPLKKMLKVLLPTCLGLFLFGSIASAHVTVAPKTSMTGAWETYTLKVPVEKEIPTTKVTIKAPTGIEIMSYQPVPGWNYSSEKDAAGKVKTFTFEATGEGILPGQFQQFTFVAKNPDNATKAAWDAYQYYKDGSIVEWTGDEGADTPHSITDIIAGTSTDHHDSHSTTPQDKKTKKEETKTKSDKTDSLPLILSIISVLLALVAVIFVIRKK
ncbi:YcnI family protein [Neobacillus sp. NPDC058068]|uniref:YcnI family copper-binding membrane protein n=1 Tax=Neobacillus sp. NPDC058068 TaxID=3346325 RepID=UPI0036DA3107